MDEGAYEEARVELLFLYAALAEIEIILGGGEIPEDVERLRSRASRLAEEFESSRGADSWWKAS